MTAGAFAGFGTWLLLRPQALSRVGVEVPSPTARAEIRAFYGGLEIGLAVFFAAAAATPAWHRPALLAQTAALGGSALARLFSITGDPPVDPLIRLLAVLEGAAAIGGAALLARETSPRSREPETHA
jgi:hypothetical protein